MYCAFCLLQKKRKLPKVNQQLAVKLLEYEETENETKDENETNKPSKKKKALDKNIFEDERFKAIFEDKV